VTLPWQPAKTAPENKFVLVLTDQGEMVVARREPTTNSFLGRWVTSSLGHLKSVSIGWPIAWTDLPDLPSAEEIEKFREIQ
jgi:hypothetical protein